MSGDDDEEARWRARMEAKIDELARLLRRVRDKENAPPVGPKFRRGPDGKMQRWLGEGTGWEDWGDRPLPPNAEIVGAKKEEKKR